MSKVRKCVLCAEQGKDVLVCANNRLYCHFHMLCEMEVYSQRQRINPTTRRPIQNDKYATQHERTGVFRCGDE